MDKDKSMEDVDKSTGEHEELPRGRNHNDEELKNLLKVLDEGSLKALQFGLSSTEKHKGEEITNKDTARLMELNEEVNNKKHF